jgi:replicative DNA helicase
MMLYREEYYDEFTDRKWITDILIRKNRNWPIWNTELMFQKNNQKFVQIERSMQWEYIED